MKSFDEIRERKLTSAELKKREEIAMAIARKNPGMDKSKKMAIATAQAKKVAESTIAKARPINKLRAFLDKKKDQEEYAQKLAKERNKKKDD